MQKKIELPKEHLIEPEDAARRSIDGDDVEGHRARQAPDDYSRRTPSTGGELSPSFPSTGGDLTDDDDVEGHRKR
jgi:hypothetical protein